MAWDMQKMNEGHKALVDLIVANPTATNSELGARLGRSKEWVMLVKHSSLFQEAIALRKAEIVDPVLTASIDERLEMAVGRSIEVLAEKLAVPSQTIDDTFAIQAAGTLGKLKGMGGFGAKLPPTPPAPPQDRLTRLAERLLGFGHQDSDVADAVVLENKPEPA